MPVTLEQEEEYYLRCSIEQLEQRHGQRMQPIQAKTPEDQLQTITLGLHSSIATDRMNSSIEVGNQAMPLMHHQQIDLNRLITHHEEILDCPDDGDQLDIFQPTNVKVNFITLSPYPSKKQNFSLLKDYPS